MDKTAFDQPGVSISGDDIFNRVIHLSNQKIISLLETMIASAQSFDRWGLADQESVRLLKLVTAQQKILISSFKYQLKKHFNGFKHCSSARLQGVHSGDWKSLGLVGGERYAEIEELDTITTSFEPSYQSIYHNLTRRLEVCVNRKTTQVFENPLHIKLLCVAFQSAINSLNLEIRFKNALYRLFSDRFIALLGPFYQQIDFYLYSRDVLPEMPVARTGHRSELGLSSSRVPRYLQTSNQFELLMILQDIKQKSSSTADSCVSWFSYLREQLHSQNFDQYDDVLNQLELLFKLIFDDNDLPENIKLQIARLQIYVFISAVREDGFFTHSRHPARLLIDTIVKTEVELACSQFENRSSCHFIEAALDEMTKTGVVDSSVYTDFTTKYIEFSGQQSLQRQKAEQESIAIEDQKLSRVARSMLAEITAPLDKELESLVLFDEVWFPTLVLIAIDKGLKSADWQNTIAIVKTLAWTLLPGSEKSEQEKLIGALPDVIFHFNNAMESLELPEHRQATLRQVLEDAHAQVLKQTIDNVENPVLENSSADNKNDSAAFQKPSKIKNSPGGKPDPRAVEYSIFRQAGRFQKTASMYKNNPGDAGVINRQSTVKEISSYFNKGDWVDIDQGTSVVMAKLIWKSEDNSFFIFIDRQGNRIREIDDIALADAFEKGSISPVRNTSIARQRTQFFIQRKH